MREIIAKQLDEIHDLANKPWLKEVLSEVFLPLYEETERKYRALEERVWSEIPMHANLYGVYSGVTPKAKYDPSGTNMTAMCPEDLEGKEIMVGDIWDAVQNGHSYPLVTAFYKEDYLKCHQLTLEEPIFKGVLLCKDKQIPFSAKLEPAHQYWHAVEKLYGNFQSNGLRWSTANLPYLGKMFNLQIVELGEGAEGMEREPVYNYEIDYREYKGRLLQDIVPVWNIESILVRADDFPMPTIDRVNYEYRFDVGRIEAGGSFLVDFESAPLCGMRREADAMVVISPEEKSLKWCIYHFKKPKDSALDINQFPVYSNLMRASSTEQLQQQYGQTVTTRAELMRLLNAYEVSAELQAQDFNLGGKQIAGETYSMNPFLVDEIRDPDFMKTLCIQFSSDHMSYLSRDLMSFLVSQIQWQYPAFNCVGVLV